MTGRGRQMTGRRRQMTAMAADDGDGGGGAGSRSRPPGPHGEAGVAGCGATRRRPGSGDSLWADRPGPIDNHGGSAAARRVRVCPLPAELGAESGRFRLPPDAADPNTAQGIPKYGHRKRDNQWNASHLIVLQFCHFYQLVTEPDGH